MAMSLPGLLYLVGMLSVFIGQRLLDGFDGPQILFTLLGVGMLGISAGLRLHGLKRSKEDGLRFGHRVALSCVLVGIASLVMYAAVAETVLQRLALAEETENRWVGVWSSLWPIVWLLGTIPLLVVDYAIESSPVMMPVRRVRDLVGHGIVAALAIAIVFPINYIATKRNERWDLAYFQTTAPGTATLAIAESLESPVDIRVFMPPSSEVAQELRAYFEGLAGPNITIEYIDQAAEPRLAKALSVRDNGVVTFTQGEVVLDDEPLDAKDAKEAKKDDEPDAPKPITRQLKVGTDLEKAKRTLKKLDSEVQTILRELGHGERLAYLTTGHGEAGFDTGGQKVLDLQITEFKNRLKELGFKVKSLGAVEGLADKVPDDADVVLVLGPMTQFRQSEADALRTYVQSGGALLVAMEPGISRAPDAREGDPLLALVEELGVKVNDEVLAAEQGIEPVFHNQRDRLNILTNGITHHGSTSTLAQSGRKAVLFTPVATSLEEVEGTENRVTFTIRSLAFVWADLEPIDLEYSADQGESKSARNLAAAIEGGSEEASWRAIITADASIFSDFGTRNLGNQLFIDDGMNWLIGAEALSGTTENEEDVKIQHTKEGQTWWFYSTVLGIPLVVLVIGAIRTRVRRGGAR
jgi:hypothetical protein